MLFPDNTEAEDSDSIAIVREKVTVWNFFGGVEGLRGAPLQQLVIHWGGQDLRQPVQVEVRRVAGVEFPGSPTFSQNLPNKRFAAGTWLFLADDGTEYRYSPETQKVESRDVSSL